VHLANPAAIRQYEGPNHFAPERFAWRGRRVPITVAALIVSSPIASPPFSRTQYGNGRKTTYQRVRNKLTTTLDGSIPQTIAIRNGRTLNTPTSLRRSRSPIQCLTDDRDFCRKLQISLSEDTFRMCALFRRHG
jgi:hypothetical protein